MAVIQSNREYALAVLTGYILILHFVGEQLTRFQIAFVDTVYSMVFLYSIFENHGTGSIMGGYRQILLEQSPELTKKLGIPADAGAANEIELTLVVLIYLGSILFMWSIRNRKPERPPLAQSETRT